MKLKKPTEAADNKKMKVKYDDVIDDETIKSIFPFVFKENKDCVEMGDNYIRVLCITQYPEEQRGNWLSDLKRLNGNITIAQYVEKTNESVMIEYYSQTIQNKNEELYSTHDAAQKINLQKDIESAQYQLDEALSDKSGFVVINTYILMQAMSLEDLNDLESRVQRVLTKLKLKAVVPYYRMADAYWSCLPLCNDRLYDYTYQMSNTSSSASFFPFDDSEVCDLTPRAQYEGINKKTESLVSLNYNDTRKILNRNKIVTGTSGVGKSTYLDQLILSNIAHGNKMFILDPENEHGKIVSKYGGIVVKLSSISDTIINPLEFFSDELVTDEVEKDCDEEQIMRLIRQQCQQLRGFFKRMKADLSQVEMSIIEFMLMEVYQDKHLEKKPFHQLEHKDFPILEDLYIKFNELKQTDPEKYAVVRDFHYIMHSWVYGSNKMFNGYTNIDLTSDIICFDLSALQSEKDVQAACYQNTFKYLWDNVIQEYKKHYLANDTEYECYLMADEFHFLLQNEESCDFFYQAYKRFRKYKAGCIVSTQQIRDLLNAKFALGDIASAIIENSYTKVFFGMDNKGTVELINKLQLNFSDSEISLLKAKRQGEALLICGTKRVFMKVELPQEEMRLLNKGMYYEIYKKDPEIMPDYYRYIHISPIEREEIKNYGGGK